MQSLKKGLIVAGILVALGSIGTIMNQVQNPAALRADDEGGPKVTLVAPLPLPVNVNNTPSVNVNNTPNVHVTNSPAVLVGNPSSSPVLTRSVDDPGLQPFQFTQQGPDLLFRFAVPAGKTLVIENLSAFCLESAASMIPTDFRLLTNVNGVEGGYVFAPSLIVSSDHAHVELLVNQVTHVYAGAGTLVTIGDGSGIPPGSNCTANVAGHLVSSL
jgi:hypothetical protein